MPMPLYRLPQLVGTSFKNFVSDEKNKIEIWKISLAYNDNLISLCNDIEQNNNFNNYKKFSEFTHSELIQYFKYVILLRNENNIELLQKHLKTIYSSTTYKNLITVRLSGIKYFTISHDLFRLGSDGIGIVVKIADDRQTDIKIGIKIKEE